MIQRRGRSRRRKVQLFLIFFAFILATGCTGINRMREAQDAFNQAAALENQTRFDHATALENLLRSGRAQPASEAITALSSIRNGYTSALLSLDKIEAKDVERLKQDGLWGNVLILRALTEWRLGLWDESLETAAKAKENVPDLTLPRDRALMEALPGLIKIDQAYRKIQNPGADRNAAFDQVKMLLTGNFGAVKDLDRARAVVEKNHPVQIYVIQSQFAAYRNLMDAHYRLKGGAVPREDPAKRDAERQLRELNALVIEEKIPRGSDLVKQWADDLALDKP